MPDSEREKAPLVYSLVDCCEIVVQDSPEKPLDGLNDEPLVMTFRKRSETTIDEIGLLTNSPEENLLDRTWNPQQMQQSPEESILKRKSSDLLLQLDSSSSDIECMDKTWSPEKTKSLKLGN